MTAVSLTAVETRRYLAEEIRVSANIRSPRIVNAFAQVPRDRFLPPGPWIIRGMADVVGPPRRTDDADPRHVHHDVAVAIDHDRQIYNGQPSLIARWFDAAGVDEGQRVVHIGTGSGYFTALLAHIVGPTGRVQGIELEPDLARQAVANLAEWPWVTIQQGNGVDGLSKDNDVVLVHAGATHVLDEWLDALGEGGRVLLPLTSDLGKLAPEAMKGNVATQIKAAGMPNITNGFILVATRVGNEWRVRPLPTMPVSIYSLREARDERLGAAIGKMMLSGKLMKVTRLRRDPHDVADTCVLHAATTCLTSDSQE